MMKAKEVKKIYLISTIIVIFVSAFSAKNYSDLLKKEGLKELYEIKNRKEAIRKIRAAQIVWPFSRFDEGYQSILEELNEIEYRSAVNVVLSENVSTSEINVLVSELQSVEGVRQVKFISQEEAIKMYKEENKNSPILLKSITPNLLPQTIEVYLDDFSIRNWVEQIAKSKPFVNTVVQSL